jgi:uroporphyrinogen-III decarboxylase
MPAMTKKERIAAVFALKEPDCVPVFPRNQAQMIYSMGWKLSDVTGVDWYDWEKSAQAALWNLEHMDYDSAFGCYYDTGFGVPASGGKIEIPEKYGMSVTVSEYPIENKDDYARVVKKFPIDPVKDPRMGPALKSIRAVVDAVGSHTPVTPAYYTGLAVASLILMRIDNLSLAMVEEPEFVDDLCRLASDFAKDWIRAQYEAGANGWCYLADFVGTELISPAMAERFITPYVVELSQMVQKEFGQRTFYHVHGDMKRPKSYAWLEKIVKDANLVGLHLDQYHDPAWVKENIRDKMGVAAGIPIDGADPLVVGPIEKIQEETKNAIEIAAPGGGVLLCPSGQVLPSTPNENFKAWVDAVHKYGKYPIGSWKNEA